MCLRGIPNRLSCRYRGPGRNILPEQKGLLVLRLGIVAAWNGWFQHGGGDLALLHAVRACPMLRRAGLLPRQPAVHGCKSGRQLRQPPQALSCRGDPAAAAGQGPQIAGYPRVIRRTSASAQAQRMRLRAVPGRGTASPAAPEAPAGYPPADAVLREAPPATGRRGH